MKILSLSLLFASSVAGAFAQTVPTILPNALAMKVSRDGKTVIAQDVYGDAIIYDTSEKSTNTYGGYYPGNGNNCSNTGIIVGQSMTDNKGAIIASGKAYIPMALNSYDTSSLDAITPDGTRACGWITNTTGSGPMQVGFYCDITEGTVENPILLPAPQKDFFGDVPQFCTATYISDDGKRIAGIVMDGSGFYSYPIVYTQDENGEWSYYCPSEPMFNPEGLPLPRFPQSDIVAPEITDFMTPEKRADWYEDWENYEESGGQLLSPWEMLDYYLTDEEYQEYLDALTEYNEELWDFYDAIDRYWEEMAKIGENAKFVSNMALSPDGNFLMADLGISNDYTTSDIVAGYQPYMFNLTERTYQAVESRFSNMLPLQILSDGTVVTMGAPIDMRAYCGYIKPAGAEEFMTLEEYLEVQNSPWLEWMRDNLVVETVTGTNPETGQFESSEVMVSGIISFSDDMKTLAGGMNTSDMYSYVFSNSDKSEVETIPFDNSSEIYRVYNLQGVNVMTTKTKGDLDKLPKGIYIINGRKFKI